MKRAILATTLCVLSLSQFSNATEKPEKEVVCQTCHGAKGKAPLVPSYPKLAGQNEAYLISALNAYKSGLRQGSLASVMSAQAKSLTDDEIKSLALFYSQQQP